MYRDMMSQLGQALASGAQLLLQPEAAPQLAPGQALEEYGERLCTAFAAFGPCVCLLGSSQAHVLQQVRAPALTRLPGVPSAPEAPMLRAA